MFAINKTRSIHSGRLERWLGAERIANLSHAMTDGGGPGKPWYGPPINITDCPGSVWICRDGDFIGDFDRGFFHSAADSLADYLKRLWKEAGRPIYMEREPVLGAGFTSISYALSRASSGFSQLLNGNIAKTGITGVATAASSLWTAAGQPGVGAIGSAAPGGRAPVKSTTGAMLYNNPSTGTLHLTGADFSASFINNSLLLYDRIFDVAKTMNSAATESVTGVPTRYQSSTPATPDFAGGNFLFFEIITTLAATAHNWTVCQYRDESGNDAQTLPTVAGVSGGIASRFDLPVNTWFAPLAAGDGGIMDLHQLQLSASVATGTADAVIGHPIGVLMFPVISALAPFDWLTNRNQAPRIFDDACLALIELPKPTATATTYSGMMYATSAE